MPIAIYGSNGDNATSINASKSIQLAYSDEFHNEVKVENLTKPIEFYIPRYIEHDYNYTDIEPKFINASNTQLSGQIPLLMFEFNITTLLKYALNIKIITESNNSNASYLIYYKSGRVLNATYLMYNYDHKKYFCQSSKDLIFNNDY